MGQSTAFTSAARTPSTAQDQQGLICVEYDLSSTCISVMDGVVIYIDAYCRWYSGHVLRGYPPNKGKRKGENGPCPVFKPQGERGQIEGVILRRSIISEHIYLFTSSFIEADTQFI